MIDERGQAIATRHHAGGWWINVLCFGDDAFAWTLEGDERAGRLAASAEEAKAGADAWIATLDHDCVALGCGDWTEIN